MKIELILKSEQMQSSYKDLHANDK